MKQFLLRYIAVILFVVVVSVITVFFGQATLAEYANMILTVLLIALIPMIILILWRKKR